MKDDQYEDDDIEYVSKSELKRDAERLKVMGKELSEMTPAKWAELPISENLRSALKESQRLKQNEAKRRHLQYIGKLMREEDVDAIQHALDLMDPSSEVFGRLIRQQEMWRTRLINDNNGLNDFIEEYPHVDRQQLRNLVRNASKEMSSEPPKPGSNYKKLFQLIREVMAD
ncbi:MAG: hypothetical protein CMI03_17495 [Oceanospirillaceae bacterium]|uniref:ribosome biogenesis factor YjgA n=1 Tax=unclassified Thalassolituus TaxID=2624967 RepID=UPI000C0B64ED|nr:MULTISPECIES: ribosome biogenesis factor YjgA [unclassified Thalassolituus]MAK91636.1 hypothetical protein [Thalassolituus sp.]MAS24719.1 hypothetical protein [Oceanospirillaceae bacterium]MBL36497.1 hypothetical protein [Oceanospirillaceae bacterium]MBS54536.1 hypothetical protein [Oceanospirillaceae bacterium]|tara:strand:- start:81 stop:593 length:513 start_codon:yes stop_codon:yes gene_type:complete